MLDDVEDAQLLKMPMPEEGDFDHSTSVRQRVLMLCTDIEVPPGLVPPLQEEEDDSKYWVIYAIGQAELEYRHHSYDLPSKLSIR